MSRACSALRIEGPAGQEITSLDDWLKYAPPKKREHWVSGRSAKESARAWLADGRRSGMPAEIAGLLYSHDLTRAFRPKLAIPELVTDIDNFGGEHRNHDVVVVGEAHGGLTLLAIEAKADESFGNHTVKGYLDLCARQESEFPAKVEAARLAGKRRPRRSNVASRIEQLCGGVFGPPSEGESVAEVAKPLRYQLVTALAGTLIEARARNCVQAVLVVHEFLSRPDPALGFKGTTEAKVRRNALAFRRFVDALADGALRNEAGLTGPLQVPGSPRVPGDIAFLVGKATRRLN